MDETCYLTFTAFVAEEDLPDYEIEKGHVYAVSDQALGGKKIVADTTLAEEDIEPHHVKKGHEYIFYGCQGLGTGCDGCFPEFGLCFQACLGVCREMRRTQCEAISGIFYPGGTEVDCENIPKGPCCKLISEDFDPEYKCYIEFRDTCYCQGGLYQGDGLTCDEVMCPIL